MPNTGWVFAGTGANVTTPGTTNWANPSRITASDNSRSTASNIPAQGGTSRLLYATNFSFGIPAGATILGVSARIERSATPSVTIRDHTIQLILGGTPTGDNLADTGSAWGTSETNVVTGGPSSLWGLSLTYSDVSTPDFGVMLRVINQNATATGTASVDAISMQIEYEGGGGNGGAFFALFSVKERLREILNPKPRFWLPDPSFA